MDKAEFIVTIGQVMGFDDSKFDMDEFIDYPKYFKGYLKEEKEWKLKEIRKIKAKSEQNIKIKKEIEAEKKKLAKKNESNKIFELNPTRVST